MAQDELLHDPAHLATLTEAQIREAFGDEDAMAVANPEDLPPAIDSASEEQSPAAGEGSPSDGGVAAEGSQGQSGAAPKDPLIQQRDGIIRELSEFRSLAKQQAEQIAYLQSLVQQRQQEEAAAAQAQFDNEPDPFKRIENLQRAVMERQARLEQMAAQQARQAALTDTAKGVSERYTRFEAEFQKEHPDYLQAAQHVLMDETRRLTFQGIPEHEAQRLAAQKILESAWAASTRGENAPQRLYEYARTVGYQAPQAPPQAPQARIPQRPVSLSKVSRSAPSNTQNTGLKEPSDLLQNDPNALYALSAPGREKDLERYMRELEVAAGGTW